MDIKTLSRQSGETAGKAANKPGATAGQRIAPPQRRWLTRVMIPLVVVLAILALVGYAMRDQVFPATEVSVVRATAITGLSANVAADDGTIGSSGPPRVVAQAPGWVEPDPYPIYVTALADGVVRQVHVLEGEPVKAEQVLVQLVDDDAKLALRQARADLTRQQAVLTAARTDLNEPIALIRADAVARANLAGAQAALVRLDAEVAKESAKLAEFNAAYDRFVKMSEGSVSALQIDAAKYQAQSQKAVVEATRQRQPELEALVDSARAERAAARRELELKIELHRLHDEAEASVAAAKVVLAEADLRLQRMTIKSPVDGVVMDRRVAPGSKLMLGMDEMHSAHAIHLYNPAALQVRVDVPLADAASVGVGQRATIIVDVLPDREFTGVVTRLVHQADIAKNTVQFKVAISKPSPLLKPDMLARVKFFATPDTASAHAELGSNSSEGMPVVLQRSALIKTDDAVFVWWVTPTGNRLERRQVSLGNDRGEGLVEVLSGLNPGDVIVDQPDPALHEGQRVRLRE